MMVLAFPWPLFFACDMEILNKGVIKLTKCILSVTIFVVFSIKDFLAYCVVPSAYCDGLKIYDRDRKFIFLIN